MLEKNIVANLMELAFAYDDLWFGDKHRLDDDWSDHIEEFRNMVLDWAEEFEEEAIFHFDDSPRALYIKAITNFSWSKFKEEDWMRPDFSDPKMIKAIVRDAGFSWSEKYDQILNGKRMGNIVVMTPDDFVDSVRAEVLSGDSTEETQFAWLGFASWDQMLEELRSGKKAVLGFGNIACGTYQGEPYVVQISE